MLTLLKLDRFKNFKQSEVALGNFTLIVGTNASGKSNLRDALRFLHGVGRSYTLADIIGGKWGPSGREWEEIRGGLNEVATFGEHEFGLEAKLTLKDGVADYRIEVRRPESEWLIKRESLRVNGGVVYDVVVTDEPIVPAVVLNPQTGMRHTGLISFSSKQPILSQAIKPFWLSPAQPPDPKAPPTVAVDASGAVVSALQDMRFLDLLPNAMRIPSPPGQTLLGDHGEYLASVLSTAWEDHQLKRNMADWIKELTPVDVTDFEFLSDAKGNLTLSIVDSAGGRTSAYSVSDGTLRFLGLLAAILGPHPASIYFIEEIDTGIHPSRLHLLVELIESQARKRGIQVIATTHSPQTLAHLNPASLESAQLLYRHAGDGAARFKRIVDLPGIKGVLEKRSISELQSKGWLEYSARAADDTAENEGRDQ